MTQDHNRYGNETLIFHISNYLFRLDRLWLAPTTSPAAAPSQQLQPRLASPALFSVLPVVCSTVAASPQPPACLRETIHSRNTPKWPAKLRPWNKGTCDVLKSYREKRWGGVGWGGWVGGLKKKKHGLSNSTFFFLSLALICSREQQMILRRSCEDCIFFFLLSASQTLIIYLYIEYAKKSWGMLGKAKWLKIKQCRKSLCYLKGCYSTSL